MAINRREHLTSATLTDCTPSRITGWTFDDIHLETHCGDPTPLPAHSHDRYQIGLSTRDPGTYQCADREWFAPPGSIVLFNPGEIHEAIGRSSERLNAMPARIMFVPPEKVRSVACSISGRELDFPFFINRVISDERFVRRFVKVHELLEGRVALALEKESALLGLLEHLVRKFASAPPPREFTRHRAKAKVVRDYLDSHFAENPSLTELAELVHVSPFHMNRLFKREVGMPPHAYQTQVRIERAKSLLVRGHSVTEVAMCTGFFDQSHLTSHFRRIVGTSPGSYARGGLSKNLQATRAQRLQ